MKKILQDSVCRYSGDCARTVVAGLLDLDLFDVPNFVLNHHNVNMNLAILDLFIELGYSPTYMNRSLKPTLSEIAKFDGGINGYFFGIVKSQTYETGLHAVIVDIDLNIVHDPNPNQKCLKLKPIDVITILTVSDFYIDENKKLMRNEN